MRNDLNRATQVVTATLLADHIFVDLTGGVIIDPCPCGVDKALIMTQVEISLGTVLGDKHFAMLEGAHGARIHIDIWIELHQSNLETTRLQDCSQ